MTMRDRFNSWLAAKLPPCDVMSERISDQLDQQPTWRELIVMRLHLFTCVWCTHYQSHLRTIRQGLRDAVRDIEQPALSPEAKERIRRSLDAADRSSASE